MSKNSHAEASAKATRRGFLRGSLLGFGTLCGVGLLGCGSTSSSLVAQRGEVFTPGAARVVLRSVHDDVISVDVYNQTGAPMVVYRDSFLLSTSTGMRTRLPGGVSNVYN